MAKRTPSKRRAQAKRSNNPLIIIVTVVVALVVLAGILFLQQSSDPVVAGDFELERQPMMGDPAAPVEIIVFEDFKCPACRTFEETVMPRIQRDFVDTGQARLYFVNFQFIAPDSITAGIAAECAYRQSEAAFWDYKTYIYRSQGAQSEVWATPQRLVSIARTYVPELDADELDTCIRERRYEQEVLRDRQIAQSAGLTGTPSVVVNGQRVAQPSYDAVSAAIRRALDN